MPSNDFWDIRPFHSGSFVVHFTPSNYNVQLLSSLSLQLICEQYRTTTFTRSEIHECTCCKPSPS